MEKYGEGFIGQSPIPELNHEFSSNSPKIPLGKEVGKRGGLRDPAGVEIYKYVQSL